MEPISDDLAALVEPMRQYAFENPLNTPKPNAALSFSDTSVDIRLRKMDAYAALVTIEDFIVRVQFTYLALSRCNMAQLSFSVINRSVELPQRIIEAIICAFFREGDSITILTPETRELMYNNLNLPAIDVSKGIYQMLGRNPDTSPNARPLEVERLRRVMKII